MLLAGNRYRSKEMIHAPASKDDFRRQRFDQ